MTCHPWINKDAGITFELMLKGRDFPYFLYFLIISPAIACLLGGLKDLWWADLLAQFRLPYAIISGAALAALFFRIWGHWRQIFLLVTLTVFTSYPVLALYVRPGQATNAKTKALQSYKLLNFNSEFQHNDNQSDFLALVQKENPLVNAGRPTVIIGDTNCCTWTPAMQPLTDLLSDSQCGFGPQPSWPARPGRVIEHLGLPPFVPIDNIFVSKDISVQARKTGAAIGSDHLPVLAEISLR